MNILITGADGFIGKNLYTWLNAIRANNSASRIDEIEVLTRDASDDEWEACCRQTDFVFHFAGVNRETMQHHYDENELLMRKLTQTLKRNRNACPIVFASSIHAQMGNDHNLAYGSSKRQAEAVLFDYGQEMDVDVYIYRFPNVFGKWCRPEYNSVIATFCHRIARRQAVVNDSPAKQLQMVYIDDLLQEMLCALHGNPHREGPYCVVPVTYSATLQQLQEKISECNTMLDTRCFALKDNENLDTKTFSTFVSNLPEERWCFSLENHEDERGSFAEILHLCGFGQVSVNVIKPKRVKGKHWHMSKWEIFVVISGDALIRLRQIGSEGVVTIAVSGEKKQMVLIPPGYTHEIENRSETMDMIMLIWSNESFDPLRPDTYYEEVTL